MVKQCTDSLVMVGAKRWQRLIKSEIYQFGNSYNWNVFFFVKTKVIHVYQSSCNTSGFLKPRYYIKTDVPKKAWNLRRWWRDTSTITKCNLKKVTLFVSILLWSELNTITPHHVPVGLMSKNQVKKTLSTVYTLSLQKHTRNNTKNDLWSHFSDVLQDYGPCS